MAVVDVGAATPEQLQAFRQHPALKQSFCVFVSKQAALKASLTAGGSPEAVAAQQLESASSSLEAVLAADGLVQVGVQGSE